MSRLVLAFALTAMCAVAACAPRPGPRVTTSGVTTSGGPRVIFEDELKSPINWPAAQGTICKSS